MLQWGHSRVSSFDEVTVVLRIPFGTSKIAYIWGAITRSKFNIFWCRTLLISNEYPLGIELMKIGGQTRAWPNQLLTNRLVFFSDFQSSKLVLTFHPFLSSSVRWFNNISVFNKYIIALVGSFQNPNIETSGKNQKLYRLLGKCNHMPKTENSWEHEVWPSMHGICLSELACKSSSTK